MFIDLPVKRLPAYPEEASSLCLVPTRLFQGFEEVLM